MPSSSVDDRDRAIERQLEIVAKKRKAERIGGRIGHEGRIEPHPAEIRGGHFDRALSPGHDACSTEHVPDAGWRSRIFVAQA
jgi:hypothetical protein